MRGWTTWFTVNSQLRRERIIVPASAGLLPGRDVRGPLTAFAEAEAIRKIALDATGGRSYGELDSDDPASEMAMEASLLRSSLFTSVLAFGVAAAEMSLGGVLIAIASALSRLSGDERR